MLVLSRRELESIVIGSGESAIVVQVVRIRGEKVRLAIQAPPEVPVHRWEVYQDIQRERK